MGKASVKASKNQFQLRREELDLTREQAEELLEWISKDRLYRIEESAENARPDEVFTIAQKYASPELCNYYCAQVCPLGKAYEVPQIQLKDLSRIVLEMLATLNSMQKKKDRLIEIAADGVISRDEIEDFIDIRKNLNQISMTVDALQLWSERMLATGAIDRTEYETRLKKIGQ